MVIVFQLRITESYAQISALHSDSKNAVDTSSFQQQKISGTVTDKSGKPLQGVTVGVKGTSTGTSTDENGNFSLELPPDAEVLTFSFVGMAAQEITIGDQTVFTVMLEELIIGLDDVVVVGYGTQKKVNLTGAVSSVKFEETAASRLMVFVSPALSGLAAGVSVRQSSGRPGWDGASIRIRGIGTLNNSSPLTIVDGIEANLDFLNPRDIESVSVLKDAASASIYGSRAANGVILVTTKSGDGEKMSVNYNCIFSISQPVNLLDYVSDYPTYMRLYNESKRNLGNAEQFSQATISAWETANRYPDSLNAIGVPNYVAFPNTDWNRLMYNNNLAQDHNFSISGASKNINAFLSAGYFKNPGLVDYTGLERYSLRLNIEAKISKWLKIGTRTYGQMVDLEMGNYNSMLFYINRTTPGVYPVYNGNYGYPEAPEENTSASHPYVILMSYLGDRKEIILNSTFYSQIAFTKGLTWDMDFNYSKQISDQYYHDNPNSSRYKFSTGEAIWPPTQPDRLSTYSYVYNDYRYTLENLLRYKVVISDKHYISLLAGYSQTYFFYHDQGVTKLGLFYEDAWVYNAATNMSSVTGNASDWALRSWFGRLNYDYEGRYLFEANLRYDGSSRFHPDSRYGLFPSFSGGWRISKEKFMNNSSLFQNLKIRASWGKLGNNVSGNYDYQAFYNPVYYSFNGTKSTGLYAKKISNPLLEWESTSITNAGLDASLLKNRLSAEFDAYYKITSGILTTPPVYLTMGGKTAPTLNSASVSNKGIEFTLGWKDQEGQVKYSVTANFGYNVNEVTKYKGKLIQEWRTDTAGNKSYYTNLGDVSSGGQNRILEGHPINEHFLYDLYSGNGTYFNADSTVNISGGPKDGMIRTPDDMAWLNAMIAAGYQFMPINAVAKNKIWYGDYIYADLNGDKIYGNPYDRRFTGSSAMPKITFGSQMSVSWKNFDLNLVWFGQAGCRLYWLESGYNSSYTTWGFQIGKMVATDHYYFNDANPSDSTNNITASYPRLRNSTDNQNSMASTRWLYNGAFLRLRNLTFGYNLPAKIANKIFAEQIRFYVSFENLFTITSFPGLDPEMGGNTNYPVIRQIAFGINVTL